MTGTMTRYELERRIEELEDYLQDIPKWCRPHYTNWLNQPCRPHWSTGVPTTDRNIETWWPITWSPTGSDGC